MAQGRMPQIEAMYRDHAEGLLRYLERNFGWCISAEDLLQETFLRWMAQGHKDATAESPRAFLFGIARHVGLTALRKAKQVRTETIGEVAAKPIEDDNADLARMWAAITKLPEQIRETLELRLRDELSYEEIATVLEIPIGTVRSRLHTALRMLREEMTQ
jgi:RNA polymerase sigma-70 factor, ECF subfamily